jgi:acetyl esterase/lipase
VTVSDSMVKLLQLLGILLIIVGFSYHFAALRLFNYLVPKDRGVELAARAVAYGADERHVLDVYRPAQASAPVPSLVFVYGGSWDSGRRQDYEFAARALASRGYVVFVPDYRLVPQHVYPAFVDDVALAIRFAQAKAASFGGDGVRTYLVGHSAGAYNIAQAVLNPHFSVSGITAVATLAGPFDFLPFDSPKSIAAFSAYRDLPSTQPVNFANDHAPPFLLLHGADDMTVKPRNSKELAKRLHDAGAIVRHREYLGVSHVGIMLALSTTFRGKAPVIADIAAFFEAHR